MRRSFDRALARRGARRMALLPQDFPPTISFSFDDFPASAAEIGASILESVGARATWYACAGLLGKAGSSGPIASIAQLRTLHDAGHEIGNHSHGHIDAHRVSTEVYAADIARNRDALSSLGVFPVTSFSYPFGGVTLGAKRIAAQQFTSCRGILPGVARGAVDLALLPANALYSVSAPIARTLALIANLRAEGGWANLYTHDIAEAPSPWGCTPDDFRAVVSAAVAAGVEIRTVRDVTRRIVTPSW